MLRRWSTAHTTTTLLALAFVVRLGCITWFEPHRQADEIETGQIARHILEGNGYSLEYFGPLRPTAAFPPFETFIYVAIHGLLGYSESSFWVVVVLRSLLSVLTAWIVFRTIRLAFDPVLARIALVITAFHPAFIFYSAVTPMLTRPPYSMLAIAVLLNRIVHVAQKPTWRNAVLLGVAVGIGALVQPRSLVFTAAGLVWLAVLRIRARDRLAPRTLTWLATPLAVAFVIVSPWTIRNSLVFDELVLLRSDFGTLFWFGNNPAARGDFSNIPGPVWPDFEIPPAATLPSDVRAAIRQADEVQRDHLLMSEAMRFVREHPGRFASLTVARLGFFWLGPSRPRDSDLRRFLDRVFSLYSIVLIGGVLIGLAFVRDRYGRLLALLVLSYTLVHAIAHAGMHYYRMSIEPYALLLGVEGVRRLWIGRRRASKPEVEDEDAAVEWEEVDDTWSEPVPDEAI